MDDLFRSLIKNIIENSYKFEVFIISTTDTDNE